MPSSVVDSRHDHTGAMPNGASRFTPHRARPGCPCGRWDEHRRSLRSWTGCSEEYRRQDRGSLWRRCPIPVARRVRPRCTRTLTEIVLMPSITRKQSFGGADRRVERLKLYRVVKEVEEIISAFKLLLSEERNANGSAAVRELIDAGFSSRNWKKDSSSGFSSCSINLCNCST